ncbi:tRNA (Guanine-1)-methyltransferase [Carpediemonas membranifera]|uniref:tRNA (guanine(9)-N(1))-methyltransferase n=1 Tax=Carpediemonas membranifera TaxID=201153 RepID=A0A8J6BXE2_9EUKA|nr:tRNA (Guanine-1)-methyltransferase [Carpediemonas membranifera]|eukprot:KAG9393381.1 tRNA (Guanine-1)-methyltransferase [Carpediemonas membranifera]
MGITWDEKRQRSKEKHTAIVKKRKEERLALLKQTMTDEEREQHRLDVAAQRHERIEKEKAEKAERREMARTGIPIIVDLGFDDLMKDGARKSLASQCRMAYGAVMKMSKPMHLSFVGAPGSDTLTRVRETPGNDQWVATFHEGSLTDTDENGKQLWAKERLVYLSADAEETVGEIGNDILIVGGLVDKNQAKGVCHRKARELGIRTVALPDKLLRQYQFKILTTNQVVEIVAKFRDAGDTGSTEQRWSDAIGAVLPRRRSG